MITDKNDKINKIIMKIKNKILILGFHSFNLILIIFYLYPGSILGCYLYNNCNVEVLITENFMISTNYWISSNHFYVLAILSVLGIFAYQKFIYYDVWPLRIKNHIENDCYQDFIKLSETNSTRKAYYLAVFKKFF